MPEPAPAPSPSQATSQTPPALTPTDLLDSIKIVLAVVGGVGAVVALTVAYRKQRDSEVAEYREDARAFTERFTAATDQLGGSSAAVRLAGVYAMAELADDWRDGRQMCIDVLCGYLRIPDEARIPETTPVTAPVTAPATTSGTSATTSSSEREVRRTLIRVIRDHLREEAPVPWSDRKFSFEGAIFEQGDLSKIHLKYPEHMTFHGATFRTGHFYFDEVVTNGQPLWFTRAKFESGVVSFDRADFGHSKVVFDDVAFKNAEVSFKEVAADLRRVTFARAAVTGGAIDWGPFPPVTP